MFSSRIVSYQKQTKEYVTYLETTWIDWTRLKVFRTRARLNDMLCGNVCPSSECWTRSCIFTTVVEALSCSSNSVGHLLAAVLCARAISPDMQRSGAGPVPVPSVATQNAPVDPQRRTIARSVLPQFSKSFMGLLSDPEQSRSSSQLSPSNATGTLLHCPARQKPLVHSVLGPMD